MSQQAVTTAFPDRPIQEGSSRGEEEAWAPRLAEAGFQRTESGGPSASGVQDGGH